MYIKYNMSMGKAEKLVAPPAAKTRGPATQYYRTLPRRLRDGFDDTGRRIRAD
jgi:hypothetical protein